MIRLALQCIILLVSSTGLFAQSIKGKIFTVDGTALSSASVSISKESNVILKLTLSDNEGTFYFDNIPNGSYIISVTRVGFNTYNSLPILLKNDSLTLPTIALVANKKIDLSTIVVTTTKPLVEVKADKILLNVEGTINAIGSDALELIRKAPGVAVDKDENIQMSGKSGVQIYIDGKPSPLIGEDLANYLKTLQSSQIEALELITNPSAKFDAAGNAGIINIKLKKNKNLGTNGSILAGYAIGVRSKINSGININNRTKKFNVFANYNYSNNNNIIDFRTKRVLADTCFDLKAKRNFANETNAFKVGADYFENKNSTWGVLVTGNLTLGKPVGLSNNIISANSTNQIAKILVSDSKQTTKDDNLNFNANYKYANAKTSKQLNIDLDYGSFILDRNLYQPNIYFNATKTVILGEANYNLLSFANIDILAAKADYEQPIAKGTIGLGAKISYVLSDNNFKRYNVIANGMRLLDVGKSNQFNYRENINAGYINYNRNYKNIQLQAGLRAEQTVASGTSYAITPNEDVNLNNPLQFRRSYINLFPSVGVSFIKNPQSVWNITASKRVDRPNYQDLNPFEFKIDEYTSRRGNTNLLPQFSYNAGVTHAYRNKLISKLTFSRIENLIGRLVDTSEVSKSFFSPRNIALQNLLALFESYQYNYKWFTSVVTANLFYTNYKADFGGGNRLINTNATALILTTQNTFKLVNDYTIELSASYNSPTVNTASIERVKWGVDLGIQKIVLKGQGNIKISATDIFWTNVDRNLYSFGGQIITGQFKRESKQYKINFSYRFGNKQIKASRSRSSANEEEAKRLQGGG